MKKIFTLILTILVFQSFQAQAQQDDLVTGNFVEVPFEKFIESIESQTAYRFFFDKKDFDSLLITVEVNKVHLSSLLNKVFAKSNYKYAIDNEHQVFLTKGKAVALNLSPGFLQGKEFQEIQEDNEDMTVDNSPEKPVVPQSTVENKIFEIGSPSQTPQSGKVNIAGYVRNAASGEELSGVSVFVDNSKVQVMTDQFGYYSLLLSPGKHTLHYSYIGMFDTRRQLQVYSDGKLNVDMSNKIIQLKEVVISSTKEKNIRSTTMGMDQLNINAIKQIPAVGGEVDVLRAVLSLPGVKSVGEASTGLNVRGGATDQNLILFNDLNIYNPSHLFGFFSAIDPDVIKSVNLYKGSIPAKYGGRISSVLDITSLDGNVNKLNGSAGIGLLTSKLSLNGPIVKDKTTFVLGLRSTYSNWIFKLLPDEYEKTKADFYDGTIHLSHKVNSKNQLYLNGYLSKDKLAIDEYTHYDYQNWNGNIKWKHNFNSRFYAVLMGGVDHYDYKIEDSTYAPEAYQLKYKIEQVKGKLDFSYFLNNQHSLSFGVGSQLYKIHPGNYAPIGKSIKLPDSLRAEQALESALYLSDQFNISPSLSLEAGVRLNVYNYLGPQTVNIYAPGLPVVSDNLTGTETFAKGKFIKTFIKPDYRVSARYMLTESTSIKAGYNTLNQYIHQISNTAAMTPTDIWKLSDTHIAPQSGSQVSLGLYRNFKNNTIETSLEVYYKWIENYLDYKSGATLLMNHHLETDVFKTKGKAYGVEFLVKKATGKLNGWFSYNYSRSLIRQDDPLAGETINRGEWYPSNFDQPHNATLIGNLKFSHRVSMSVNATYSTGRPITLPIGAYDYGGGSRVLYSDRNEYRIPDYFRTDLSFNIEGNHKIHQRTHNSWTVGFYNLTGRRNAYSVYFVTENGEIKGYKLSIFGSIIPYITFNIKF